MGNSFIDSYKNKPGKKPKEGKSKSQLVAVRLPNDVYEKLEELREMKDEALSKTIVKALRYALDIPEV